MESRLISIFDGRTKQQARLISRCDMKIDDPIDGPALLDDPTSTLHVPGGWQARRDASDNIVLTAKGV